MIRHKRSERVLAAGLAMLAGYVDALGFIELGGYFVSFMSGNSTRLGVGLAENVSLALLPAGLIGLFVLGVVAGSFVGHAAGPRRPAMVLAAVAALLLLAALLASLGIPAVGLALMAAAMGAENAVFERDGEVSIGVTYMTGTLVKLGQRITAALLGGDRFAWTWYLLLWVGLVAGAVAGAFSHFRLGLDGLWIAGGFAVCLALMAMRIMRRA